MALIKCPECGNDISDKADICPKCGCPSSVWRNIQDINTEEKVVENPTKTVNFSRDFYIECGKNTRIETRNGVMKIITPIMGELSDEIGNFTLEYFAISMRFNVGMCIYNRKMGYTSGIFDVVAKGDKLELLKAFKNEMERNGLFSGRSRAEMLYKQNDEDKKLEDDRLKSISKSRKTEENNNFDGVYRQTLFHGLQEVHCPRCGSEDCTFYKEVIPEKTKTRYTMNLNPLKPFTLVNKKQKVVSKQQTVDKFMCNKCGKIFY